MTLENTEKLSPEKKYDIVVVTQYA